MIVCPKCKGICLCGIQYNWEHPEHYDGVSEFKCDECGYRQGRWSGKELVGEECERRYGG